MPSECNPQADFITLDLRHCTLGPMNDSDCSSTYITQSFHLLGVLLCREQLMPAPVNFILPDFFRFCSGVNCMMLSDFVHVLLSNCLLLFEHLCTSNLLLPVFHYIQLFSSATSLLRGSTIIARYIMSSAFAVLFIAVLQY